MRKSIPILAAGCLMIVALAQGATDHGPWKVSSRQFGVATSEVKVGTEFQIMGQGFHAAVLPVKVCVYDRQCQLAEPDRAGEFMVNRTLSAAGDYEIWVFQARDANISEWRLRAKAPISVRN
jgi:hypothetical protein